MGQYVSKSQIAAVKEINVLDYLRRHEPHELVRCGREYSTMTHDSLKIREDGVWHWFSHSIGGRTALDYLIHVKGMNFLDAVHELSGEPVVHSVRPRTLPDRKPFQLPEHHGDNRRVTDYLHNRGIPLEIIEHCIRKGLIYESAIYHNAVFIGFDAESAPRYAMMRTTGSRKFVQEIEGSNKRFSFSITPASGAGSMLVIAESAIDALSCAALSYLRGKDWTNNHYVSMGGANSKRHELPVAIEQYLQDHFAITDICLMLDNDKAGRMMSDHLYRKLKDRYNMYVRFPSWGKDVNDELIHRIESIERNHRRDFRAER